MSKSLINRIENLNDELKAKGRRPNKERVITLIEKTKEISKELDEHLCLKGDFYSRIDYIYADETEYPRRRLNKVVKELNNKIKYLS